MQFLFIPLALVLGLLLGAGVAIGMFVSLSETGDDWLYRWQTLLSGIIAFVGGALTVAGIVWQVQRQLAAAAADKAEQMKRKRMAARALLAADLSEICAYTERCARSIKEAHTALRRETMRHMLQDHQLSARVLDNFRDLIEFLDFDEAEVIADILATHQILAARYSRFVSEFNSRQHIGLIEAEQQYLALTELRVRTDSAFDFARRNVLRLEPPAFTERDISAALNTLDLRAHGMSDSFRATLFSVLSKKPLAQPIPA